MRFNKRICAMAVSFVFLGQTSVWPNISNRQNLAGLKSENKHLNTELILLANFLKEENINSLDQYVLWFKRNMSYKSDGIKDQWAKPFKTILKKAGDCEDLAFLNKEVLRLFGIHAKVLGTQKGKEHHVFCVFSYKNKIYIFDNTDCIKTKAETLEEIALFLYNKYDVDYVLEVELEPKSISVLFSKSMMQKIAKTEKPSPSS